MAAALKRELKADPERIRNLILAGLDQAEKGDFRYWKEIFDRLDGKTISRVAVSGGAIDWTAIDNEGDTERPAIDTTGPRSLPESGEA